MDEDKGRQNFLFYRRWYEQMRLLPNEEKLLVYESICDYAFNHVLTEMAYYLESIMMNIRQTIDANERKQDAFCEKQRRNVMKRWERRDNESANAEDTTEYERIPRNTTEYDGISGNTKNTYNKEQGIETRNKEQGTKNKEEIEEKKDKPFSSSIETSSIDPQRLSRAREEENSEEEKKAFMEKRETAAEAAEFFAKVKVSWNLAVSKAKIPMIAKMTDIRRRAVAARAAQHGEAAVLDVIQKAAASSFLNGGNGRGFLASFDWVMRPTNFLKVMEGNYDNRPTSTTTTTNNTQNGTYPQRQNYQGGRKDIYGRDADAYEQRTREFEAYAAAKLASSDPDKVEEFPF